MLSIIVYGRYDYHGYNYHKRTAISLNCLAELLTAPEDEIIYVDYNTPNDLPTLPEAISDTLTDKTKNKIRVLRARPEQHKLFAKNTTLDLIEPVARNIALVRSNPANQWILSTNSDMIFVPHDPKLSLTNIVSGLKEGFYTLPRFELPEYWWESSLSRTAPAENLQLLQAFGKKHHFQMTTTHHHDYILYDNPGDCQLTSRKALLAIQGFNESMQLGWHVDANLCKRLFLYFNKTETLIDYLYGYHCNHIRKDSTGHRQYRSENSWKKFVTHVATPYLPEQAENFGHPNMTIEEIRLSPNPNPNTDNLYLTWLQQTLSTQKETHYQITVKKDRYNYPFYYAAHTLPYLTDHLITLNPDISIAYLGYNAKLLSLLGTFWQVSGRTGIIFCLENLLLAQNNTHKTDYIKYVDMNTLSQKADLFVIDFGFEEEAQPLVQTLETQLRLQSMRIAKQFIRLTKQIKKQRRAFGKKFISINAVYSDFRRLFDRHIQTTESTYYCNVRYGYIKTRQRLFFKTQRFTLWRYYLRHFVLSTIHYYICYCFPIFTLRCIKKLRQTK